MNTRNPAQATLTKAPAKVIDVAWREQRLTLAKQFLLVCPVCNTFPYFEYEAPDSDGCVLMMLRCECDPPGIVDRSQYYGEKNDGSWWSLLNELISEWNSFVTRLTRIRRKSRCNS